MLANLDSVRTLIPQDAKIEVPTSIEQQHLKDFLVSMTSSNIISLRIQQSKDAENASSYIESQFNKLTTTEIQLLMSSQYLNAEQDLERSNTDSMVFKTCIPNIKIIKRGAEISGAYGRHQWDFIVSSSREYTPTDLTSSDDSVATMLQEYESQAESTDKRNAFITKSAREVNILFDRNIRAEELGLTRDLCNLARLELFSRYTKAGFSTRNVDMAAYKNYVMGLLFIEDLNFEKRTVGIELEFPRRTNYKFMRSYLGLYSQLGITTSGDGQGEIATSKSHSAYAQAEWIRLLMETGFLLHDDSGHIEGTYAMHLNIGLNPSEFYRVADPRAYTFKYDIDRYLGDLDVFTAFVGAYYSTTDRLERSGRYLYASAIKSESDFTLDDTFRLEIRNLQLAQGVDIETTVDEVRECYSAYLALKLAPKYSAEFLFYETWMSANKTQFPMTEDGLNFANFTMSADPSMRRRVFERLQDLKDYVANHAEK